MDYHRAKDWHPSSCTCVACTQTRLAEGRRWLGEKELAERARNERSRIADKKQEEGVGWVVAAALVLLVGALIGFVVVSMPSETIGEKVQSGQASVISEPSSAAQTNTPPTDGPMLAPVNPAAGLLAAPVPLALVALAPEPTAIPTATPTAVPPPNLRHIDEKRYMLELINAERTKAGLDPVVLGDNRAAQLHAEAALQNCFSSHWGVDGLKPYMRYSLAGGYQSNGENGSGSDYCIGESDGYRPLGRIYQEIRETMDGWLDSPGHRRNICVSSAHMGHMMGN